MNPDRIFRESRDDALAKQFEATEYKTFVAMPFADTFSYRSEEIYRGVIQAAANRATRKRGDSLKPFAAPRRADDLGGGAVVITEEIVMHILESHIYLADLTLANHGVLLETGIAMGYKPNEQIILITQGQLSDLHFDLRNNRVMSYNMPPEKAVDRLADALIGAATAFDERCERQIKLVSKSLTSDAMRLLNFCGQNGSLHRGRLVEIFREKERADVLEMRYEHAMREVLSRRLMWTDYRVRVEPGVDAYAVQATELGWAFIEYMWPDLKGNREKFREKEPEPSPEAPPNDEATG